MRLFIKNTLAIAFILFSCLPLCAGDISVKITKKYLNLPISHQTDRARMQFEIDGKQERSFVIRLAPNDAD
jgi:fructan beta-fructosidase